MGETLYVADSSVGFPKAVDQPLRFFWGLKSFGLYISKMFLQDVKTYKIELVSVKVIHVRAMIQWQILCLIPSSKMEHGDDKTYPHPPLSFVKINRLLK